MTTKPRILVTGGAGYVGSVLTAKLLEQGYRVRVFDLMIYSEKPLAGVQGHPGLEIVRGDIRDLDTVRQAVADCDSVVHLACISNDPSFELDPQLGKTINYDSFLPLVDASRDAGASRFVFASSSSVYGVKEEEQVTEELSLEPLTDYSRYKALCEEQLLGRQAKDFTTVIVRPATVCGYSPRLRLDLTVNILTNHAINAGRIRVFGGSQYRPNIHIEDVTDLYVQLLELPADVVAGKIWNAGWDNMQVAEIAEQVRRVVGADQVEIRTEPTDDLRSYRISSERIRKDIGFVPRHSIADAIEDLHTAFRRGAIPDPMQDDLYYNVKRMQNLGLQ